MKMIRGNQEEREQKEAEVSVQWKENSINPNKQQKQWNKHWKGV